MTNYLKVTGCYKVDMARAIKKNIDVDDPVELFGFMYDEMQKELKPDGYLETENESVSLDDTQIVFEFEGTYENPKYGDIRQLEKELYKYESSYFELYVQDAVTEEDEEEFLTRVCDLGYYVDFEY